MAEQILDNALISAGLLDDANEMVQRLYKLLEDRVKRRVAPAAFVSINPATGRRLRAYRAHSPAEVAVRLRRARAAFVAWRDWPLADRAAHLRAVARALRRRRAALAALLTAEMGKPLAQALAEIEKSAAACDY